MALNSISTLSRLSPFPPSLFAPSPPTLPSVPTLAELQVHASNLTNGMLPARTTDSRAKSIPSVANAQTNKAWFVDGSPPKYTGDGGRREGGAKLKKIKVGWMRMEEEEKVEEKVKGIREEKATWWEW